MADRGANIFECLNEDRQRLLDMSQVNKTSFTLSYFKLSAYDRIGSIATLQ
jgi:hypothetical protein